MQVKKLNAATIRKTESKIRTGGQRVITAEQKIRTDLTTSTMDDEEADETPDNRWIHNRRTENPILKYARDMNGAADKADTGTTYQSSKAARTRAVRANTENANIEATGIAKANAAKTNAAKTNAVKTNTAKANTMRTNAVNENTANARMNTANVNAANVKAAKLKAETARKEKRKALNSGGRYRTDRKRGSTGAQKSREQVVRKSEKSFAKETARGFSQEAAKAGKTAATGAATAGVSIGVTAVEKSVKMRENRIKRAKARLLASVEADYQQKKESARLQNRNRDIYLQEESKQEEKFMSGAAKLFIPMMLPLVLMMVVFAAIFGSMVPPEEKEEDTLASLKIIDVAKKEEAMSNKNIGGEKYKTWYGLDDNWCAMFVSWCANQCGYTDIGIMPRTASVAFMKKWYMMKYLYQPASSGYEPKPGDIIIFGNGKSHTGIVIEYHADTKELVTIEGNTGKSTTEPYHKGSCVRKKTYALSNKYIDGYGTPKYPTKKDTEETEEGG